MDIVDRLRKRAPGVEPYGCFETKLDAAAEIERLRAELSAERELADRLHAHVRHHPACPNSVQGFPESGCLCGLTDAEAAWRERRGK